MASSGRRSGVLDEDQLVRIKATHRGFLYQHLYAVSCLLRARDAGYAIVRIEADEDIELEAPGRCRYVQVKTRSAPLMPSDLSEVLLRFESIRDAHARGERGATASFAIAANVEAGPRLGGLAENGLIPADVLMALGPNCAPDDTALIPPPSDLPALFDECVRTASALSLSRLRPESLVWKLAALVAWAATSERREFLVAELPTLCEFVEEQLHTFPQVERYLPQQSEPALEGLHRVSVVVAGEGAGKTTWAGTQSLHCAGLVTYFRCSGIDNESVAARLVREAVVVAAKADRARSADLLLPGATGLEPLAYLDKRLGQRGTPMTFVVDDAHGVEPATLADAVSATSHIRWVVLTRPGDHAERLAARLKTTPLALEGWSEDTIARVLQGSGCTSAPDDVARLRRITGGAPLFVVEAVDAAGRAGGATSEYLHEVEAQTSPTRSAQEILLAEALEACDLEHRKVAAAVSLSGVPGSVPLWKALLAPTLAVSEATVARCVQHLVTSHILTTTEVGEVTVHDAYRVVLRDVPLDEETRTRLRQRLRAHLTDVLRKSRHPSHLLALLRLLAEDQRYDELGDLASGLAEIIRDLGITSEVYALLTSCLQVAAGLPEQAFWLEDTLAFFDLVNGDALGAKARLDRMENLLNLLGGNGSTKGAFRNKSILIRGALGTPLKDIDLVEPASVDDVLGRVTSYNAAVAMGTSSDQRQQAEGLVILSSLIDKYLSLVGLDHDDLFGVPLQKLAEKITGVSTDDIRRLGDCFDATSRLARRALAHDHPLAAYAIPALKMYDLAHAPKALIKTARNQSDWFLETCNDRVGAAEMLANYALPAAKAAGLLTDALLVRAQLAEVHALLGQVDEARAEIESLGAYASPTPDQELCELRASLERAQHHLDHPPEEPIGWYGQSGSIGLTSRQVLLRLHRGWTIAVGQDVVDLDWGFQARRGFFWSRSEFMLSAIEPLIGMDFYPSRDLAYEAAKRKIDGAEVTREGKRQSRRRERKALSKARKDKRLRRKERKRSTR